MQLSEIKTEIVPAGTEAADNVLLELGIDGWSILEDVIEKRAWIVGVFADPAEARQRWSELVPLLQEVSVESLGEPVVRDLGDRDWKDSYKAHFKAWQGS